MLLASLSLIACETSGPATSQAFCGIAKPIYLDKGDEVSDRTARAVVGHNEVGARLCGWQPPAK